MIQIRAGLQGGKSALLTTSYKTHSETADVTMLTYVAGSACYEPERLLCVGWHVLLVLLESLHFTCRPVKSIDTLHVKGALKHFSLWSLVCSAGSL